MTDHRHLPFVTIDGSDAKDFDDAVYVESCAQGWRLYVAIADVSHYVEAGSELDIEAFDKGTSVYFPGIVHPMLPEHLSNGTCSLRPDEDRRAMVCEMLFDRDGNKLEKRFYRSEIRSQARMLYEHMQVWIDKSDSKILKQYKPLTKPLDDLYSLYQLLHAQRSVRKTLDFDFPEPLIEIDPETREVVSLSKRSRLTAHKLIEEFMLVANVSAAECIDEAFPDAGVYRVHEGPDEDSLKELRDYIVAYGLKLGGGNAPTAKDYALLMEQAKQRNLSEPQMNTLQIAFLRSLKQALYTTECKGHFALNFSHYTHFTSPIRRYPDLVVHRLLRQIMGDAPNAKLGPKGETLETLCVQSSEREREAEDWAREVVQSMKAQYMRRFIGDEFEAYISGVAEFGVFVQLHEHFVDGLVHITLMGNDYFNYDAKQISLVGDRSGQVFALGDAVTVSLIASDGETGKIDFDLKAHKGEPIKRSPGKQKRMDKKRAFRSKKPSPKKGKR